MPKLKLAVVSLLALVIVGLSALAFSTAPAAAPADPPKGSVVKIEVSGGHGSGAHIGNGYILTAAHVIGTDQTAQVKTDDGRKREASVLWVNTKYDVALIRVFKHQDIAVAPLNCRIPKVGEALRGYGNPLIIEFMQSWGRVGSKQGKFGSWEEAIVVDMTVAPGMSGGPVLDASGNVVGIIVGLPLMRLGMTPSAVPFTFVVPARTACNLMGRA
jgi:S1-C subfamily serine protease